MNNHSFALQTLHNGLESLGLSTAAESLMQYLFLLEKWNRAYNLTAIRDIDQMVTRHLLDSLAISPLLQTTRLLDVGSGAGLPGIPLALVNPDLQVTLLDSNGKKIRFMQEAKRILKLNNIEIQQSRVENYHPLQGFDTVTSRAFSDIPQMISLTKHLVTHDGKWLAMKGRYPETELSMVNYPYNVNNYSVPGLEGERCCVIINNVN